MFKNWFRRERKQSAAGVVTAINLVGRPVWTPRNYGCLAAEGFGRNAVAYRCIRMIAEACASVPLRVESGGRRTPEHPLQKLIDRPNAEQGGADLREALYASLQTAGNLARGQWGSEQALAAGLADGAAVIVLPANFVRADMTSDERGLNRLFRIGRKGFGATLDGALDVNAVWTGLALRPRAPVHGGIDGEAVSWLRSPRYGGDSWEGEPPLCEESELYRVQVLDEGGVKRSLEVSETSFAYTAAMRAADFPVGLTAEARIEVAQKSAVYGYGPVLTIAL